MSANQSASPETISIIVNEQPLELPAEASLEQLLQRLGLSRRGLAIELNGEIVAQRAYAARHLRGGDRVEVVSLVGGG